MTSLLHPKTYARLLNTTAASGLQQQQQSKQAQAAAQQGCTTTKGLLNKPGQNNCFLNSAVQVLWHLDIFRRSFRELAGHACMAESCIFCALKELFGQLQFSQESALPPDALRRALAESFFDQQRFQLGFMDDAAECFENILMRVHYHIASGEQEDMCNARHCIPHQKFAMTLVEQSVCEACHVTSEPLSYTQMVHYVSASALTTQARPLPKSSQPELFGQLLRKAGGMGDIRDCPSSCGAKIQICRSLMNRPEIVSVGVVWDSERPTLEHIMAVFATIGTSLRLSDVFHSVMDQRWAAATTHSLVGVVTYYGKHYSTFFFHTKLRVWIYFDDATVREIGPRFEQVVEKCRRGRYQPLLLLYAVQGGSPVSTDTAPKTTIQVKPESMKPCRTNTSPKSQLPSQIPLRRSVTPSPEKTRSSTSPRRAITPNPDNHQRITPNPENYRLPNHQDNHRGMMMDRGLEVHKAMAQGQMRGLSTECYADYQNLADMQAVIFQGQAEVNGEAEYISRKAVETMMSYQKQSTLQRTTSVYESKKPPAVQRTNSSVSSDGGVSVPDHLNVPRRRDSGNWSGDRNSASSSSSLENPYLYLVGKLHSLVPRSPTSTKPPQQGEFVDPGYDSYSLSSNDSLPLQQGLKLNLHLAQIPENQQPSSSSRHAPTSDECELLCLEADRLLDKSRLLEEASDLQTALVLSSAAAAKSRAAMDAPYNNPQTLTFARMKHNACVMRVRSLHRRLAEEDGTLDIRHSRENSASSNRSNSHSRQSSRDKTAQHSRQSSRELVTQPPPPKPQPPEKPSKSIEIYATLPRKKLGTSLKGKTRVTSAVEDEEYMYERPGRSMYSRAAAKKDNKVDTKRARSEERNKNVRDYLLLSSSSTLPKESPKNEKGKAKEEKKKKEKVEKQANGGKKQHKIRRKLLMGGLIRRKNCSMPDLREGQDAQVDPVEIFKSSQDDSTVGLKNEKNLSGYLSEGHLEYSGANPGMERSRLMRKTSHGSTGKVLLPPKVPPLPPLRTTSQLTTKEGHTDRPKYPLPSESDSLNSSYQSSYSYDSQYYKTEPVTYANGGILLHGYEEDIGGSTQNLELPPYPSPLNSVNHSRQPSVEFPPPPPPLDEPPPPPLEEPVPPPTPVPEPEPNSLLAQLQLKRQQILEKESSPKTQPESEAAAPKTSDQWLRELQAKQAERKAKKLQSSTPPSTQSSSQDAPMQDNSTTVRDLASRFENAKIVAEEPKPSHVSYSYDYMASMQKSEYLSNLQTQSSRQEGQPMRMEYSSGVQKQDYATSIRQEYVMNHQKPEYVSSSQNNVPVTSIQNKTDYVVDYQTNGVIKQDFFPKTDGASKQDEGDVTDGRRKSGKKKNVTFCDEVILVATAEDDEEDSFIPNPILQRVLRSAFKFDSSSHAVKQEMRVSHIALKSDSQEEVKKDVKQEIPSKIQEPRTYGSTQPKPVQNPPMNGYSQQKYQPNHQTCQQSQQSYQHLPHQLSNNSQQRNVTNNQQNPSPYQQVPTNSQQQINTVQNSSPYQQLPSNSQQQINTVQNSNPYQQLPSSTQQQINTVQNSSPYQQLPSSTQQQINTVQNSSSYQQLPSSTQQQINTVQNSSPYQQLPSSTQQQINTVQNSSSYQQLPSNYQNTSHPYTQPPSNGHPTSHSHQQMQPLHQQNSNSHLPSSAYQQIPANSHQVPSNSQVIYQQQPMTSHQNTSPYQHVPNHPSSYQQLPQHAHQASNPYQQIPSNGQPPQNQQQNPYQPVPNQQSTNLQYPSTPHSVHKQYQQPSNNSQYQYGPANAYYHQVPGKLLPQPVYQRVTNGQEQCTPPYQHPPPPRQASDVNANKTGPCHLCRKKPVASPAIYCTDCHFYMSRFKPRT